MRVNFTDSAIPDYTPIPPSEYHCVVTDGTLQETDGGPSDKNPTGQYVNWEMTVQDGEYAGRKVWTNTPLGGKGIGFLKAMLWSAGQIDKDYEGDLDFEIDQVIGKHVLVRVTVDKERDSNQVKRVRPYEGASAESLLPA